MPDFDSYLEKHRLRFEEDLCELLRIPSVSTEGGHREALDRAAQWMVGQFRAIGLQTELIETAGHPIVFAQSPPVDGAPTALVYGHYDVQPPDPLDAWISPPFEPTRRDGNIYARGATDDKGQMLTHVKAAQAWMETQGALPIQLKFLIEGEEEIGSESLHQLLETNGERLKCDVVTISDMPQFGPGQPAVTYGLRGIACYELRLVGPKQDLHSGTFGGAVSNPAVALAQMLAALIDENGRIQVPGFYDDVSPMSDGERDQLSALPFDQRSFMDQIGVSALSGESGYSTLERRWARPTFDVNGLTAGYQGEGAKTVLPSSSSAKFSFRLVPDQDPKQITASLTAMLEELCPPGIEMELTEMHASPGVVVELDSPAVTAAVKAIERGFGRPPVFIREGGSVPIITAFCEKLQVDTLMLGWGLPDDNTHSPNEKLCLADFHRGIRASAYLWEELSKIKLDT